MPLTGLTAPFKVTLFFHDASSINGAGFSENYHWNATSYANVQTALPDFINARLGLSSFNVVFDAVRISYPGQKYQDLLLTPSLLGITLPASGTFTPTSGDPTGEAPIDTCLLWRVRDVNNYHTTLYMHGVPSGVLEGSNFVPDDAWNTVEIAWTGKLTANVMVKQPKTPNYSGVTAVDYIRASNRKVGRPFNVARGRR